MVAINKVKKLSRYERPWPAPKVRWTAKRRELVRLTWEYRLMSREVAQRRLYGPGAKSQVQRDLTHLSWAGVLRKLPGRAPNACDIYEVSRIGLRRAGLADGVAGLRRRQRPPSHDHALAVNGFRAQVEVAAARLSFGVARWLDELDLSWMAPAGIVPDAFFELVSESGGKVRRSGFFLEAELTPVGRGHWRRRLAAYIGFHASGRFQERFGMRALRLLCVVEGLGRQATAILEEAAALDLASVWVTTWQEVRTVPAGGLLFVPIWRRPVAPASAPLYGPTPANAEEES
jgi:hypothetical protein